MANHPSALKRQRQAEKRRARYKVQQNEILQLTKQIKSADSKKAAVELLKKAQSRLAKIAQKGKVHKNTASRKIASLFKQVNAKS